METSTKWLLGGGAGAIVLYLLWPKKASAATPVMVSPTTVPSAPAPLMPLASKPGALLIQPDPNTVMLVPSKSSFPTIKGPAWAMNFDETVSLGGNVIARHPKTDILVGEYPNGIYAASGPIPPAAAIVKALLFFYTVALPTSVTVSNQVGPTWIATYTATGSFPDITGQSVVTKNVSLSVPLPAYPSGGPQPPKAAVDNAVYNDLLTI